MIFAAGLGTRLHPYTENHPKALYPVDGKPLLYHCIMKLKEAGVTRVVINVHHFADQIIEYVEANDLFGLEILFSDERSRLLETGGGIRKAIPLLRDDEPILIHNVDILSNLDINWFYNQFHQSNAEAMLLVSGRPSDRKLLADPQMRLCGWMNQKSGEIKSPFDHSQLEGLNRYSFSGIHLIHPSMCKRMDKREEVFPIMDFYLSECADASIYLCEYRSLEVMDVGKMADAHEASLFLNRISKPNNVG